MPTGFFLPRPSAEQWTEFAGPAFTVPVAGIIFENGVCPTGVPLGGIGTGFLDLNPDGRWGRGSIYNSFAPPREFYAPWLSVDIGGKTHTLATAIAGAPNPAANIRYWGHYPVADLEYELEGPLGIGLRAWSPFIPGDATLSNVPAIVLEFLLTNPSAQTQVLTLSCTLPGPSPSEAGGEVQSRTPLAGPLGGIHVRYKQGDVVLATADPLELQDAGPEKDGDGITVRIHAQLGPGESRIARLIFAWYFPRWAASPAHHFRHAYAERFTDAAAVAWFVAERHGEILQRIIAWQSAIYARTEMPAWLRDQLVNVLHTIARDSLWAGESVPAEAWYRPTGLFGMLESPRTTPHACNPSDWYGNLPIVFFFPELAASLLRSYSHFQLASGEIPLGIGEGADLTYPVYHQMHIMNSCVHIQLVDRVWLRTRDQAMLREFYPSVVRSIAYMQSLDHDGDGLPDLDPDPFPNQFYGAWAWKGSATYVNGFWLASLAMAERMAEELGDTAVARDCRLWRKVGARTLEQLWFAGSYLLYQNALDGTASDTVLANQLAGAWCGSLHGLTGVFPPNRVQAVLATVARLCSGSTIAGMRNAARRDGAPDPGGHPQSDNIFVGECLCVVATMAYSGHAQLALQIAERLFTAIVLQHRVGWDLPNLLSPSGQVLHGTDFYQDMLLWALPLALEEQDLETACAPQHLVGQILTAARARSHVQRETSG